MARLGFIWKTGDTLTYEATEEDGTVRTAAGTSIPEITGKGYYTVVDADVITSDVVVISDSARVIGGGDINPPVILSSDGLDSVSTTEPSGLASNFREMIVQTWRRFFGLTTFGSQILHYKSDGTTVATTQQIDETTSLATQGEAS